ncbi:hypothetical protein [Leucobacter japonicus]|uniref:hypothetical protein n=1 Tax=Leucobacter japonicus TaxID=1461259 RepID=UPI0006A7D6B3|nr:hypothetical protein [Leucobacter japonicus]
MAKIREDLVGAVHVDGYVLVAGDEVPDGVSVGAHLTGEETTEAAAEVAGDEVPEEFDPLADEPEAAPTKPRGRPRKTQ